MLDDIVPRALLEIIGGRVGMLNGLVIAIPLTFTLAGIAANLFLILLLKFSLFIIISIWIH